MGGSTFSTAAKRLGFAAGLEPVNGNPNHLTTKYVEWPSAKEAFAALAEDDRYENGHSYSGGIGMKHDFTHIATVDTIDEAGALAEKLIEDSDPRVDDKWGPAGCITIREGDYAFLFFGWASS